MHQLDFKHLSALRAHEARLLALMLRTSRLTWLFAAEGTDKTALLRSGVLPLMQRRHGDRLDRSNDQGRDANPTACADRRLPTVTNQSPRTETVIYFDEWGDSPIVALKELVKQRLPASGRGCANVDARLASVVAEIQAAAGVNLVFVLNDFERFLAVAHDQDDSVQFVDEWIEAVVQPGLAASFLIALNESSRARLERFKGRIPGLDHNSLRLLPEHQDNQLPSRAADASLQLPPLPHSPSKLDPAGAAGKSTTGAQVRNRHPATHQPVRSPIKVEEVYAFIESTLARTAAKGPLPFPYEGSAGPAAALREAPLDFEDEHYDAPSKAAAQSGHITDRGLYDPSIPANPTEDTTAQSAARRLATAFKRIGGWRKR
jgi:hypothetical protein